MWLITGLRIQVKSESNIYSETVNIVFSWLTTEDIQLENQISLRMDKPYVLSNLKIRSYIQIM